MANNIDRGGGSAVAGWMPGTYTTYTDPTDRVGQLDPYSSNGYITAPDTINAAGNLPAWGSADEPMSTYILNQILKARTPGARTNPAYVTRPDDNGNMITERVIPTNVDRALSNIRNKVPTAPADTPTLPWSSPASAMSNAIAQSFIDGLTGSVEPGINDMQARANAKRNYETRRKNEE